MELTTTLSEHVRTRLARAERIAVLTGAGISAESGVPTFRDPDGLWARFRPEELASMEGFLANPERVWQWYQHRRHVLESVQPNPAHRALVQLENLVGEVIIITQNVDRLHQRAGSHRVLELHGNLEDNYCSACGRPYCDDGSADDRLPPRCPSCGGLIRPAVVWFGEPLPADVFAAAERAARRAEVFLVVGTSCQVYPAAALPQIAWECGATIIEINPLPKPIGSIAHAVLPHKAGSALPALVEHIAWLRATGGTEQTTLPQR
ncbi:MAG: NAD-dependent protein deacylase [Candidatus Kapaibacterium sp.]|nr:MAG: NAD-dependent protein deacylase [Candidatus Kapabacteria bacterium]